MGRAPQATMPPPSASVARARERAAWQSWRLQSSRQPPPPPGSPLPDVVIFLRTQRRPQETPGSRARAYPPASNAHSQKIRRRRSSASSRPNRCRMENRLNLSREISGQEIIAVQAPSVQQEQRLYAFEQQRSLTPIRRTASLDCPNA